MFRQSDLEAYLDEALPAEEMARIEKAVRSDRTLVGQLASIRSRRNAGVHSLAEIWRRHRLSCPTREELADYLLGVLSEGHATCVAVHLDAVGCRFCQANAADLRTRRDGDARKTEVRRRKFITSSADYLKNKGEGERRKGEPAGED
jgi:hypothetical protein